MILMDPATFNNVAGQTFELQWTLNGSFGIQALGPGASAEISETDGSDLPGLGELFQWTLSVDGSDPADLQFVFRSNPELGLDDGAIEALVLGALDPTFNPSTGSYSLSSDLTYLTLDVTVPDDQSSVSFSWDTMAAANVPEPSTILLLGGALVGLGIVRRRKA
jgi:hypothetical protein